MAIGHGDERGLPVISHTTPTWSEIASFRRIRLLRLCFSRTGVPLLTNLGPLWCTNISSRIVFYTFKLVRIALGKSSWSFLGGFDSRAPEINFWVLSRGMGVELSVRAFGVVCVHCTGFALYGLSLERFWVW